MRRSKFYLTGIYVLLVAFFIAGCGGGQSTTTGKPIAVQAPTAASEQPKDNKVYELNLNSFSGSTDALTIDALEPWKKLVEEKTEGRVKVNLFFSNALGSVPTALQDVRNRVYEVGLLVPIYFGDTNVYPLTIGSLPFALVDNKSNASVMTKFAEKYKDVIWNAESDVLPMGLGASDTIPLFSTKPIKSFKDVKNVNIRATDENFANLVKAWEAIPVPLPQGEVYEGLQKGVVDATTFSVVGFAQWQLHEVAKYVSMPINTAVAVPIMNKQFYEELPEDLRKLFDEELNQALAEGFTESFANAQLKALETIKAETGNDPIVLPPEEEAKFKAPTEKIWDQWVQIANGKGFPGDKMMADFKAILQEEGIPLPY